MSILPNFVLTLLPSTIGSRSRCTPSLLGSCLPLLPLETATLSISSIKMMPSFCARLTASALMLSISKTFSLASLLRATLASLTFISFLLLRVEIPITLMKLSCIFAISGGKFGFDSSAFSLTSISILRSSRSPHSSLAAIFS